MFFFFIDTDIWYFFFFFFQAEDGIRVLIVTGVQTCALPICLVIPYRPRLVMVYAGENDLAEGSTAEEVLRQFTAFVDGVHDVLPQTRIAFISIKPSPTRLRL